MALLKKEARQRAEALGAYLVLCHGAPGIGSPVISSLSGAGLAVIVTLGPKAAARPVLFQPTPTV